MRRHFAFVVENERILELAREEAPSAKFQDADALPLEELKDLLADSKLIKEYNEAIDRESAYELLNKKIEIAHKEEAKEKAEKERAATKRASSRRSTSSRSRSSGKSALEKVLSSPTVIRSVLGILSKLIK